MDRERQGPWDRCCRHGEQMRLQALVEQAISLMHTETVLFIHHHQPQAVEHNRILEQSMGAHQHLQGTIG